ncbi:MAG TPA: PQQ-binding-like beta-propeller repeat protein [Polyangia bacterium]|nr:PQQ-binding-like beta-propeller repeat protein [Polyangia bacterium]
MRAARPPRLWTLALLVGGCASVTARPIEPAPPPAHPAGILHMVWRSTLHEHGLFEPDPEECATAALTGSELVLGSRAATIVGVSPDTGHIDWITPVSGGVDSAARFDAAHGQVYVGADDGTFYAVDPANGSLRWTYHGRGAFERAPELSGDLIYAASATDHVVALEAGTGKWRWQYEREMPDGFTIHGYAGPRLVGDHLLTGFADGYLVSLAAATGEVVWARSLASTSDQFVDVDTTPALAGNLAYVSSYSGGLCAVDLQDGAIKWRLPIPGVGDISIANGRLFFVAPRQGVHSADLDGHVLWRQGLTEAGDLTRPTVVGPYLIFSGSRAGLFVVDRTTGELQELFNPGHGVCAAPMIDETHHRLYVLSNGGAMYALEYGT